MSEAFIYYNKEKTMGKEQEYFRRIYSLDHCLSTEVPSNSSFLAVRQLEYQIKKELLPLLVLMSKDKTEQAQARIKQVAKRFKKEDSPFVWLYRFGYDLNEGFLTKAETLSLEDFKRIHNSIINKAFSFSDAMSYLSDVVDAFIDKAKDFVEEQIDAFARNLSSGITSLANSVFQQGMLVSMTEGRDPDDVYITKIVYPGACKYCIATYLNPDGSPKIFRLSDLEANGFDLRRKPSEYVPVLLGLHYNCRCTNMEVPKDISKEELQHTFDLSVVDWCAAREMMIKMQEEEGTFIV